MSFTKSILLSVFLFLFVLSCGPDLDSDKGKYSFALGTQIGSSMKRDEIDIDVKAFQKGFKEGLTGEIKSLTQKDMIDGLKVMTQEIQKRKAEKEAAAKEESKK